MRTILLVLISTLFSSCAIEYSASAVDYDDLYVTRHYDWHTNSYRWYQYQRSYVYPSPYNGLYPYERVIVTPIIVVPQQQKNHEYGKRPTRESIPNHNHAPSISGPRRGRN